MDFGIAVLPDIESVGWSAGLFPSATGLDHGRDPVHGVELLGSAETGYRNELVKEEEK